MPLFVKTFACVLMLSAKAYMLALLLAQNIQCSFLTFTLAAQKCDDFKPITRSH